MTARIKRIGRLAISAKLNRNVECAVGRTSKPDSVVEPFWRKQAWKKRKREIILIDKPHSSRSFRRVTEAELWQINVEALALNVRLHVDDCYHWEYLDIRMTILALDCELKPSTMPAKVDLMRKCVNAFAKCEKFAGKTFMDYHSARHRAAFILATWESELAKRDSDLRRTTSAS